MLYSFFGSYFSSTFFFRIFNLFNCLIFVNSIFNLYKKLISRYHNANIIRDEDTAKVCRSCDKRLFKF